MNQSKGNAMHPGAGLRGVVVGEVYSVK